MPDPTPRDRGGGLDVLPRTLLEGAETLAPLRGQLGGPLLGEVGRQELRREVDPLAGPLSAALVQGLRQMPQVAQQTGVEARQLQALYESGAEAQRAHLLALRLLRGVLDARLVVSALQARLQARVGECARARLLDPARPEAERAALQARLARVQHLEDQRQADQARHRDELLGRLRDLEERIAGVEAEVEVHRVMAEVRQRGPEAVEPEVLRQAALTFQRMLQDQPQPTRGPAR